MPRESDGLVRFGRYVTRARRLGLTGIAGWVTDQGEQHLVRGWYLGKVDGVKRRLIAADEDCGDREVLLVDDFAAGRRRLVADRGGDHRVESRRLQRRQRVRIALARHIGRR